MSKILEFKNKDQQFEDWYKGVFEANFKDRKAPPSAILIWEEVDDEGMSQAHCVHYNCEIREWEWFKHCLDDKVQELLFDKWIREHLDEYIEYLNGR